LLADYYSEDDLARELDVSIKNLDTLGPPRARAADADLKQLDKMQQNPLPAPATPGAVSLEMASREKRAARSVASMDRGKPFRTERAVHIAATRLSAEQLLKS
jgi:hypothetical protein